MGTAQGKVQGKAPVPLPRPSWALGCRGRLPALAHLSLSFPQPCPLPSPPTLPEQEQTRRQTRQHSQLRRWRRGMQGTCLHFPGFPDPDLNPRSASCQPGCSQADIAAGAFSAAFPQICLLRGLLKRSPRFLCYSRLHWLPSSKAWAPWGPQEEGATGAVPGLTFARKREDGGGCTQKLPE